MVFWWIRGDGFAMDNGESKKPSGGGYDPPTLLLELPLTMATYVYNHELLILPQVERFSCSYCIK